MTRRPTRSTRTDTLFPYTTLFRDYLDRIIEVMMDCVDRGMRTEGVLPGRLNVQRRARGLRQKLDADRFRNRPAPHRSEEHTSELQSLMRISYAVFCLNKKQISKTPD